MSGGFDLVPLGEVLKLRRASVQVERDTEYQFAGVRSFARGVFRSVSKKGSAFSYRVLNRIRGGEFVYPKLMAWEGALGVVPVECDGLFVSPEFCVFEVDESRVLPRWLELFFKQPTVWPALAGGSAGTNMRRRRIHPDDFLAFKVPLPSVAAQRAILSAVDGILVELDHHRRWSDAATTSLEAALSAEFWRISCDAPRRPMGDIAPLVRREVTVDLGASYPELGVRSFGRGTFHKPALPGTAVGTKRLFQVHPGDLVFNIVFAWEGAVAVAREGDAGRVGSHRFLTCVPRAGHALSEFLAFYFQTEDGLAALGEASPGGAGRNRTLGLEALAEIRVPVAVFDDQQRFTQMLRLREEAQKRREASASRREALIVELLQRVFASTFGVIHLQGEPVAGSAAR